MKTKFIIRFKGTAPNHYDAPRPRLIEAETKKAATDRAWLLAERDGLAVSSVRRYFGSHKTL